MDLLGFLMGLFRTIYVRTFLVYNVVTIIVCNYLKFATFYKFNKEKFPKVFAEIRLFLRISES